MPFIYLKHVYRKSLPKNVCFTKNICFYQNNRVRPLHVDNRNNRRKPDLAVFDLCRSILFRRWHRRSRHDRRTTLVLERSADYCIDDNL